MPNFNKSEYIEESINSVINQTFIDWNLILVDDYSTDQSRRIIEKFKNNEKINVIFLQKNKGVSFSRNLAIRHSKAKYISFLDSDDIWDLNKLENQISFMEKNNYNFTYTSYVPFTSFNKIKDYKKTVVPKKKYSFKDIILDTSIGTSTMIIKKSSIGNTKFPKIKSFEDYPFKYKILKNINAYALFESNTYYRITKNSLSSNKMRNLFQLFKVNKSYNKLHFFLNLKSIFFISINSIKKYGFK